MLKGTTYTARWKKLKPRYQALISFIDVAYGAILGYGFYELAYAYKKQNFLVVFLLSFAILYLIGDYVDSRLFTEQYQYQTGTRFFYDLGIGVAFLAVFISATEQSIVFVLLMALVFLLGGKWCLILGREFAVVRPLKCPKVVAQGHLFAAVLFAGRWYRIRHHQHITNKDAGVLFLFYLVWAFTFVLVETFIGVPAAEADLFPNFPIGRFMRKWFWLRKQGAIVRRRVLPRLADHIASWIDDFSLHVRALAEWLARLSALLRARRTKTNDAKINCNDGTRIE